MSTVVSAPSMSASPLSHGTSEHSPTRHAQLTTIQAGVVDSLLATRIIAALNTGTLRREQYVAYLGDVYCYALHSAVVIAAAGSRLVHTHPVLATYLFRHAGEEIGHDVWAASDLRDLGVTEQMIARLAPSTPCRRMIALEYFHAMSGNPIGLFGWMFVLESLGGRVGGQLAHKLDEVLRLGGKGIYFLSGHGEADSHHSIDLAEVIGEHVRTEQDWRAFADMVDDSVDLYCQILDRAYAC